MQEQRSTAERVEKNCQAILARLKQLGAAKAGRAKRSQDGFGFAGSLGLVSRTFVESRSKGRSDVRGGPTARHQLALVLVDKEEESR